MRDSYDVVIAGGAAIGSAIAYFLAASSDFDGTILLVERDPSFARAATSLSASALRTQFSNGINVQMTRFSHDFMMGFAETMAVEGASPQLNFHHSGYLFLAQTGEQAETLRSNHAVQVANGADVALLDPETVAEAFPHLRTGDLALASYGRSGEGWFDNTALMNGFRAKARALGVDLVTDTVTGVETGGAQVRAITLAGGGRVATGRLVNAAGTFGPELARMAGLSLPVETRKRTLFVFDCAHSPEGTATINGGRLPLMVEPNGVYVRPEGKFFLVGCSPVEDPEVARDDFEPRYDEFEEIIWPTLAERSEAFEAIKVVNQWAGHFDLSLVDHNPILGAHPEMESFVFANGFSGHGLMQAPAVGRGLAELMTFGGYRSLDLSPFGYERVRDNRPFHERVLL